MTWTLRSWLEEDSPNFVKGRFSYLGISLILLILIGSISSLTSLAFLETYVLGLLVLDLAFAITLKDNSVFQFFIAALTFAIVVYLGEYWLVLDHFLAFHAGNFFLEGIPLYIFALWITLTIRIGYFSWLLLHKIGIKKTTLLITPIAFLLILWGVGLGISENWWEFFHFEFLLFSIPVFVYTSSFSLLLFFPSFFYWIGGGSTRVSLASGIFLGLIFWLNLYAVSFF